MSESNLMGIWGKASNSDLLKSKEALCQCGELRKLKISPAMKKAWNKHFYEKTYFFSFKEKGLSQKCYPLVLLKLTINLKFTSWLLLWTGLTLSIKIQQNIFVSKLTL